MKRVVKIKGVADAKKAQIWIETVIYTLIAFAILGAVLSFAKPKIEKLQDKSVIEQSIKMLEDIDSVVEEIKDVPGNQRQLELKIKKGSLSISGATDKIVFNMDSKYQYSESGVVIESGNINITDTEIGKINKINATLDYNEKYNVIWNGADRDEQLSSSSALYKMFISSEEGENGGLTIINFKLM